MALEKVVQILATILGTPTNPCIQFITKDPYIDVRAYGAKGDGVTDDTTAIQNAINGASVGMEVFFPAGTYKIITALTISTNFITIKSNGAILSVIGAIKGFNISGNNVTINNLTITGDNTNDSFGIYSSGARTRVTNCKISEVEKCIEFDGADAIAQNNILSQSTLAVSTDYMYGILVYNTDGALIQGNKITMPIYTTGTVYPTGITSQNLATSIKYNRIIDNHIYNGFDSILTRGPYAIISNNICDSAIEAGIIADGSGITTSSRTIIANNILNSCARTGIFVLGESYGFTIIGNSLYNCGTSEVGTKSSAILFTGQSNNIVSASSIIGNTVEGGVFGINIESNSGYTLEQISVIGNSVINCTNSGIIVTRSSNIAILGNNVYNCTIRGIRIASSESSGIFIDGNILKNNGVQISFGVGAVATIGINIGQDETLITDGVVTPWGISYLDSTSHTTNVTLADGLSVGQEKTIIMINGTNASTLTVAHHETSSPEVFTFADTGDTLILKWNGTVWMTIKNSGVIT